MIRIVDSLGDCESCSEGMGGLGDTVPRPNSPGNALTAGFSNLFGGYASLLPNFFNMASGSTAVQSTAAFEQIQAREEQASQNTRLLVTALVIGGAIGVTALIFVAKRKT